MVHSCWDFWLRMLGNEGLPLRKQKWWTPSLPDLLFLCLWAGFWRDKFNPDLTAPGVFHVDDEFIVPVQMMNSRKYSLSWFTLDSLEVQVSLISLPLPLLLTLQTCITWAWECVQAWKPFLLSSPWMTWKTGLCLRMGLLPVLENEGVKVRPSNFPYFFMSMWYVLCTK